MHALMPACDMRFYSTACLISTLSISSAVGAFTHLIPLCLSQELEQIAGFHQFKHNEVWIVVDAHTHNLEHVLVVKVTREIDNKVNSLLQG